MMPFSGTGQARPRELVEVIIWSVTNNSQERSIPALKGSILEDLRG
jgi:hypothetical protein